MSVSGVPSIPGFDVLFPSGNTNSINGTAPANNGTSSNGTANSATSSTGTANSTASSAPASTTQPAGFDVLFPNGVVPGTSGTKPATSTSNSTPASSSAAAAAAQNPYQAAYDNIETWSSSYLMNSVENGAPSAAGISSLSGGESANSFAQLNQTLAALKPLVALDAEAANGTSGSTTSSGNSGTSSGTSNSSTGSTIDSFA